MVRREWNFQSMVCLWFQNCLKGADKDGFGYKSSVQVYIQDSYSSGIILITQTIHK